MDRLLLQEQATQCRYSEIKEVFNEKAASSIVFPKHYRILAGFHHNFGHCFADPREPAHNLSFEQTGEQTRTRDLFGVAP